MAEGWIKLYFSEYKNEVIRADADHLAVWCYLKMHAAFREATALYGGEVVTLQPGQLVARYKDIVAETGTTVDRVRTILSQFEKARLIDRVSSNAGSLITVHAAAEASETQSAKPARASRSKKPKESIYSSDASYDLEAYAATAIGLRD